MKSSVTGDEAPAATDDITLVAVHGSPAADTPHADERSSSAENSRTQRLAGVEAATTMGSRAADTEDFDAISVNHDDVAACRGEVPTSSGTERFWEAVDRASWTSSAVNEPRGVAVDAGYAGGSGTASPLNVAAQQRVDFTTSTVGGTSSANKR